MSRPDSDDDDDDCYNIDISDDTINQFTQELLKNDLLDSFLLKNLEETIAIEDQVDENPFINEFVVDSAVCNSIWRINNADTAHLSESSSELIKEHVYSASANEIDDVKPVLKDLPSILEYAYLNGNANSPVIIASNLMKKEKEFLLQVLYKRRGALAWKMSNIKGISPSLCTHKILMEDEFKPTVQPQRRLNPKVQDVVKNEIVKLLDSGLIYPIYDSSWVSLIHVVPKKGG